MCEVLLRGHTRLNILCSRRRGFPDSGTPDSEASPERRTTSTTSRAGHTDALLSALVVIDIDVMPRRRAAMTGAHARKVVLAMHAIVAFTFDRGQHRARPYAARAAGPALEVVTGDNRGDEGDRATASIPIGFALGGHVDSLNIVPSVSRSMGCSFSSGRQAACEANSHVTRRPALVDVGVASRRSGVNAAWTTGHHDPIPLKLRATRPTSKSSRTRAHASRTMSFAADR
jgi:hypothetical protein